MPVIESSPRARPAYLLACGYLQRVHCVVQNLESLGSGVARLWVMNIVTARDGAGITLDARCLPLS